MRLGALCTGYGGLDMAVSAHYGTDLAWYSEVDKDCNQLLAHHWPGVPNLGDLTTVNWDEVDPVDVLCAGFPCQPVSLAGNRRRQGMDDERWLWDDVERCVGVLAPGVVVLENVAAITFLGGPRIVAGLTSLGYDLRWGVVRASDAGAPHHRARWFCVATHPARPTGPKRDQRAPTRLEPPLGDHTPGHPPTAIRRGNRVAPQMVEHMMGLPPGFVTDHDLSYTAAMRILGNGVCPQQAALALTLLDD